MITLAIHLCRNVVLKLGVCQAEEYPGRGFYCFPVMIFHGNAQKSLKKHVRSPDSFILVHFFPEGPLKRCNTDIGH